MSTRRARRGLAEVVLDAGSGSATGRVVRQPRSALARRRSEDRGPRRRDLLRWSSTGICFILALMLLVLIFRQRSSAGRTGGERTRVDLRAPAQPPPRRRPIPPADTSARHGLRPPRGRSSRSRSAPRTRCCAGRAGRPPTLRAYGPALINAAFSVPPTVPFELGLSTYRTAHTFMTITDVLSLRCDA